MSDSVVLFSSIEGPHHSGDMRWNGGYKSHELWCKALRGIGVEAYRVTYDGSRIDWMIEHQPVVSMETVRHWVASGRDIRPVTTWILAKEWIDLFCGRVFFYDQEMAHSMNGILPQRISVLRGVATHSRTIQAWYMEKYHICPPVIREWSDNAYWFPEPLKRKTGRVGYLNEGPHTGAVVTVVRNTCAAFGVDVEVVELKGDEAELLEQMQACDIFLGMNPGKDAFWGEGCPRAAQEAMHAGCIVIAFDVLGNHEYLIDNYTGYLIPRGRPDLMAAKVVTLMQDAALRAQIRCNGIHFSQRAFSLDETRLSAIREWLDV